MIGKVKITSDGPKGSDIKDPTLEATELRAFLTMLCRAGVGHGTRHDYSPPGTAVQVEHDDLDARHEFRITEWMFDDAGQLKSVSIYEGEVG